MNIKSLIIMILPLVVINLTLILIALRMWFQSGVRNLNKWIWLAIILLCNTAGPILFMILGKGDNYDKEEDYDY